MNTYTWNFSTDTNPHRYVDKEHIKDDDHYILLGWILEDTDNPTNVLTESPDTYWGTLSNGDGTYRIPQNVNTDLDGKTVRVYYVPASSDIDSDGLTNKQEFDLTPKTQWFDPDTDDDGRNDGWEYYHSAAGADPLTPQRFIVYDFVLQENGNPVPGKNVDGVSGESADIRILDNGENENVSTEKLFNSNYILFDYVMNAITYDDNIYSVNAGVESSVLRDSYNYAVAELRAAGATTTVVPGASAPSSAGTLYVTVQYLTGTEDYDGDSPNIFPYDIANNIYEFTGNLDGLDPDEGILTSWLDSDTDSDGMDDGWEFINNLDPLIDDAATDTDNDGLTGGQEFLFGGNAGKADSDDDGIDDYTEVFEDNTGPGDSLDPVVWRSLKASGVSTQTLAVPEAFNYSSPVNQYRFYNAEGIERGDIRSSFTLECWFKATPGATETTGSLIRRFDDVDADGILDDTEDIHFDLCLVDGVPTFIISDKSKNKNDVLNSIDRLNRNMLTASNGLSLYETNQWTHLAAVWDQQRRAMRLYVNGTLTGSKMIYADDIMAAYGPQYRTELLGEYTYGNSSPSFIKGNIDEVRIWTAYGNENLSDGIRLQTDIREYMKKALPLVQSPEEIHNTGYSPFSSEIKVEIPAAYYRFDDGGSFAQDFVIPMVDGINDTELILDVAGITGVSFDSGTAVEMNGGGTDEVDMIPNGWQQIYFGSDAGVEDDFDDDTYLSHNLPLGPYDYAYKSHMDRETGEVISSPMYVGGELDYHYFWADFFLDSDQIEQASFEFYFGEAVKGKGAKNIIWVHVNAELTGDWDNSSGIPVQYHYEGTGEQTVLLDDSDFRNRLRVGRNRILISFYHYDNSQESNPLKFWAKARINGVRFENQTGNIQWKHLISMEEGVDYGSILAYRETWVDVHNHEEIGGEWFPRYYYYEELFYGLEKWAWDQDPDGDGLNNWAEFLANTSPLVPDTDSDGVLDGDEDTDGDGLPNRVELRYGRFPYASPALKDTDDDGIWDGVEVANGFDPTDSNSPSVDVDTDGDGYSDKHEILNEVYSLSDQSATGLFLTGWQLADQTPSKSTLEDPEYLELTGEKPIYMYEVENHNRSSNSLLNWSVEARVRPDAGSNGVIVRRSVGRYDAAGTHDDYPNESSAYYYAVNYEIGIDSEAFPYVGFKTADGEAYVVKGVDPIVRDGTTWTHIAGIYDHSATSHQLKLYVNGEAVQTTFNGLALSFYRTVDAPPMDVNGVAATTIGSGLPETSSIAYSALEGAIDDVFVWNKVIDYTQVTLQTVGTKANVHDINYILDDIHITRALVDKYTVPLTSLTIDENQLVHAYKFNDGGTSYEDSAWRMDWLEGWGHAIPRDNANRPSAAQFDVVDQTDPSQVLTLLTQDQVLAVEITQPSVDSESTDLSTYEVSASIIYADDSVARKEISAFDTSMDGTTSLLETSASSTVMVDLSAEVDDVKQVIINVSGVDSNSLKSAATTKVLSVDLDPSAPLAVEYTAVIAGTTLSKVKVTASGSTEPNGQTFEYYYEWQEHATEGGVFVTTGSVGTSAGEFDFYTVPEPRPFAVRAVVYAQDATGNQSASFTGAAYELSNQPPTTPVLSVSNDAGTELLTASASGSIDPDGTLILYEYEWFTQATPGVDTAVGNPVDQDTFSYAGENYYSVKVKVRAYSDGDYSSYAEEIVTLVTDVDPADPTIVSFTPTSLNEGSTEFSVSVRNDANYAASVVIKWYQNGVVVYTDTLTGVDSNATVQSVWFDTVNIGDVWQVKAYAAYAGVSGAESNVVESNIRIAVNEGSTNTTGGNSAPTAPTTVRIEPIYDTDEIVIGGNEGGWTDRILLNFSGSTDPDNDIFGYGAYLFEEENGGFVASDGYIYDGQKAYMSAYAVDIYGNKSEVTVGTVYDDHPNADEYSAWEPNDGPAYATHLHESGDGYDYQIQSFETYDYSDWVFVEVNSIRKLAIIETRYHDTTSAGLDTVISVYDRDRKKLGTFDNQGTSMNDPEYSRFTKAEIALSPGIYYVEVKRKDNLGGYQNYQLELNYQAIPEMFVPAAPTAIAYEPATPGVHEDIKAVVEAQTGGLNDVEVKYMWGWYWTADPTETYFFEALNTDTVLAKYTQGGQTWVCMAWTEDKYGNISSSYVDSEVIVSEQDWEISLNSDVTKSAGSEDDVIELGWKGSATHGFDPDIDVELQYAPSAPGSSVEQASSRFITKGNDPARDELVVDMRPYGNLTVWYLKLDLSGGVSGTIAWDSITLPLSNYSLTIREVDDDHNGLGTAIDMTAGGQIDISAAQVSALASGSEYKLYEVRLIRGTYMQDVTIVPGWNMLSCGVTVSGDAAATAVFADELGDKLYDGRLWAWDNVSGNYDELTSITPNVGFWLYYSGDETVTVEVPGTLADGDVSLNGGWNMAGPSEVVQIPTDANMQAVWGWSGSYHTPSVLTPGYGYWFLVEDGETVILEVINK